MIITAGADYSKYTDTITTDFLISGKVSAGFSLHTAIKSSSDSMNTRVGMVNHSSRHRESGE
ncbi:hypothetical protein PN623_00380 [Parabacteroides distasonis]|uniref:hypothetical protein n=1 Tax=Parabacteroides distasonis TaxID=823 RepID=UPI00189FF86D|nr:hypothetical protein [Parabacteroides distasonis]MDB9171371.1 hypothetical protein [Parabacteroides distasonis]MDB9192794.1 hypothetical protein [Parabacteroides distasonis]